MSYPDPAMMALKVLIPFPTTYECEKAFSAQVTIKTKSRNRLNVKQGMRVAPSNTQPNIEDVVVVVIQFLFGIVLLAEMAGFTSIRLQLLALHFFTLLDSGHPSLKQSSQSPLLLAFFQIFFGRPRLFFSLTSRSRASDPHNTIFNPSQYMSIPLIPFAVANRSVVFFNPSISI